MVNGTWCMVNGTCGMVNGTWCVVNGTWCMVNGTCGMVHGTWCMVHGAWCMVHGAWKAPVLPDMQFVGSQSPRKNLGSHIDASHSRQPLVKGERLVRYEVNAVMPPHGTKT